MLKLVLPAAGLLLLVACSTEGKVTPLLTGAQAPLPAAATWAVTVQGCPESNQCEELRTALTGRLVGSGLAARVAPPGQPADLSLDVQITQLRTVSTTARVLIGTFAGRNSVVGTETLRDRAGNTLRSFQVEAASAAHPISGETTVYDAYREFAANSIAALR